MDWVEAKKKVEDTIKGLEGKIAQVEQVRATLLGELLKKRGILEFIIEKEAEEIKEKEGLEKQE